MSVSKKATKRTTSKIDNVIRLMQKKDGATIHDFIKVGFNQPSIVAVNAAKRRSMKTKVVKKPGELTRYLASAK